MTVLVGVVCLGLGFFAGYALRKHQASGVRGMPAQCLRVVDTDTILVRWLLGTNKVRLAGIDAPESKESKKLREQAAQLGVSPTALLQISQIVIRQLDIALTGKDVVLIFPHNKVEYDSFARLLAYVEVRGSDVCEMLLRNGLAYPRPEPHPRADRYAAVAEEARAQKKGIYGLTRVADAAQGSTNLNDRGRVVRRRLKTEKDKTGSR